MKYEVMKLKSSHERPRVPTVRNVYLEIAYNSLESWEVSLMVNFVVRQSFGHEFLAKAKPLSGQGQSWGHSPKAKTTKFGLKAKAKAKD